MGHRESKPRTYRYKGVQRIGSQWGVVVHHEGIRFTAGRFDTEDEAAAMYDALSGFLFGEYARKNL